MPIDRDYALRWMSRFADEMAEHRQELVRLDTAIGDGDHGTNMNRGMQKALEKIQASEQADPGAVLKTAAMALVSSVGGAAGPLYGTLFLQMGTAMAGQAEVDLPALRQRGVKAWRVFSLVARPSLATRRWWMPSCPRSKRWSRPPISTADSPPR